MGLQVALYEGSLVAANTGDFIKLSLSFLRPWGSPLTGEGDVGGDGGEIMTFFFGFPSREAGFNGKQGAPGTGLRRL